MSVSLRINLNDNLFLRDPQDTKLGQKILIESIQLINRLGFEKFTFKKLSNKIGSTEASIYRYFENKHLLLTYLVCYYWEWLIFQIAIKTSNIQNPEERIKIAIRVIVETMYEKSSIDFIDLNLLHQLVISEGAKAYHTIDVDKEDKLGLFSGYQMLVKQIGDIIIQINGEFKYPIALASNLIEMANNHIYFAQHIPKLTDIHISKGRFTEVVEMLEFFVFKILQK